MRPGFHLLLLALLLAMFSSVTEAGPVQAASPVALQCEFRTDPLGVDSAAPRLSWQLAAVDPDARGLNQTAYRILVASSPELLARDEGDLWDSGRVVSPQSTLVAYAGRRLRSSEACHWKVQVWTDGKKPSAWSRPARWTAGVLAPGDWQARWIGFPSGPEPKGLGYHAAEAAQDNDTKWVQIDLGQSQPFDAIRLHPMSHAKRDGFGFPLRFRIEVSDDPAFAKSTLIDDHTGADFPSPRAKPVDFPAPGATARYVRVTATRLWKRDTAYAFALRELEVRAAEVNLALGASVTALDSVESYGWKSSALTDGAERAAPASILLRREFAVRPRLARALVHVTGLGHYELFLNGARVGEDLLAPGWTDYRKTILYDTFDVTAQLRAGANAAGIVLGNGMYRSLGGRYSKFTGSMGPQKAIAHLRLEYADGTVEIVGTDETWRVTPGPIVFSDVYGGEDYDDRRAPKHWDRPGFDASAWSSAALITDSGARLTGLSESAPPIRAFQTLAPVSSKELRPGLVVYDLGQNTSLMPGLAVRGPAGATVRITPSELIRADGEINDTMCGGKAYWTYTLSGEGNETWFPQFFYRGARYLRVECNPPDGGSTLPVVASIEGVVVRSSSPIVGEFSSSSDLFNRIHRLVHWAQLSNLVSLISDCPTREKLGWLEQYHLNGPALRYNWGLDALFTKCLTDIADAQTANGMVPSIAPEFVKFGGDGDANPFRNSPEWGSALILAPWQQYQFSGDIDLLRRHYDGMKRYLAYLRTKAKDDILDFGLGDWYDIGPRPPGPSQLTPKALTATAFYQHDAATMAQIARVLDRPDEAWAYSALAEQIRIAFNRAFFDPKTNQYATGSQCANSVALVMGLADSARREAILANIVADVRKSGLTAGDVGYRYLLRALSDGGRSDVIFTMNHQSEKPGYGYQLARGATSLTEAWDALPGSSQNHFMLGQINEWFYHDLAGIQPDPAGPGFTRIVIKPAVVGDLAWVKAAYASPHGRIVSAWKHEGSRVNLEITIPANTTATVFVPALDPSSVTEGGRPVARVPGVRALSPVPGYAVFEVGSGDYRFSAPVAPVATASSLSTVSPSPRPRP